MLETFIVLVIISFLYAAFAAYKIKGQDSQIVGAFLAQICFCYYLSSVKLPNDIVSVLLMWHLGCFLSIVLGGSIGGIVQEHIKTDGKRTIGYWMHLLLANIIVAIIGILFLFLSL